MHICVTEDLILPRVAFANVTFRGGRFAEIMEQITATPPLPSSLLSQSPFPLSLFPVHSLLYPLFFLSISL